MRKGAVTAADSLTQRIGQRIAKQNRIVFAQHNWPRQQANVEHSSQGKTNR